MTRLKEKLPDSITVSCSTCGFRAERRDPGVIRDVLVSKKCSNCDKGKVEIVEHFAEKPDPARKERIFKCPSCTNAVSYFGKTSEERGHPEMAMTCDRCKDKKDKPLKLVEQGVA